MMQIIGVKRLLIALTLLSINFVLGMSIYFYMFPQKFKLSQEVRVLRTELRAVESDIDRMKIEFEQLDEQQDSFNLLREKGFFSAQDRSEAKVLLSDIQTKSNVISAVVAVKSGIILDYDEARKVKHQVLLSPIEIELKAFDDADIYKYLGIMNHEFPGHLSLDELVIQRSRDVNASVLRAIASGANPELVNAKIKMSWRTIIPESQVIIDGKLP